MKRILLCLLLFPIPMSFAACPPDCPAHYFPIGSISLTYDLNKTSLHVDAEHRSNNWEVDYIRMMTVSLNGQVVSTTNYYHQTSAGGFSDDVAITAQAGDVITVTVFCTGGRSKSQDLTVVKSDAPQAVQSTGAVADNSTIDNTAN